MGGDPERLSRVSPGADAGGPVLEPDHPRPPLQSLRRYGGNYVELESSIIEEFRAKHGRRIGQFGDRLLLLRTTGAPQREERITPVMYHRDDERYVVVASKAGMPDNPEWYHNRKANPVARVEVATESGTETPTSCAGRQVQVLGAAQTRRFRTWS